MEYASTPLGLGFGDTRFSSPEHKFKLMYIAHDLMTAVAERIVRDRFEGQAIREIFQEELTAYCVAEIGTVHSLRLLDLRGHGATVLGVSTDAVRAKDQAQGRIMSQRIYDHSNLDGSLYMSRITNRTCVAIYDRALKRVQSYGRAINLVRAKDLVEVIRQLHLTIIS